MKKRELLEQLWGIEMDGIIVGRSLFNEAETIDAKEQISEDMHDFLFRMFDFVEHIMQDKDDVALLNGEFEIGGIKLPLYAILDMAKTMCNDVSFVFSSEDNQRFEGIIEKARNLEFSDVFHKDWHINPRLRKITGRPGECECGFFRHTALNAVIRPNKERKYYKSTIDNFNRFLLNQSVFLSDDELLTFSDEMEFDYDFLSYPDLECDDLFVAEVYSVDDGVYSDRQRIILFEEQHEELEQKYKRLRKQVNELRKNRFKNSILPFYKDKNFENFALVSTIDWDLNDNNKMLAQQLESLFYIIRDLMKQGYDLDTILTRPSLFQSLSSLIGLILYNAEECRQKIITELVIAYANASIVEQTIFATKNLTDETLVERLEKLSIFRLAECASKMQSNILGYYHLARIIREGE